MAVAIGKLYSRPYHNLYTKICSGCSKKVPSHITPETCRICKKMREQAMKICIGCDNVVPIRIDPLSCKYCIDKGIPSKYEFITTRLSTIFPECLISRDIIMNIIAKRITKRHDPHSLADVQYNTVIDSLGQYEIERIDGIKKMQHEAVLKEKLECIQKETASLATWHDMLDKFKIVTYDANEMASIGLELIKADDNNVSLRGYHYIHSALEITRFVTTVKYKYLDIPFKKLDDNVKTSLFFTFGNHFEQQGSVKKANEYYLKYLDDTKDEPLVSMDKFRTIYRFFSSKNLSASMKIMHDNIEKAYNSDPYLIGRVYDVMKMPLYAVKWYKKYMELSDAKKAQMIERTNGVIVYLMAHPEYA